MICCSFVLRLVLLFGSLTLSIRSQVSAELEAFARNAPPLHATAAAYYPSLSLPLPSAASASSASALTASGKGAAASAAKGASGSGASGADGARYFPVTRRLY